MVFKNVLKKSNKQLKLRLVKKLTTKYYNSSYFGKLRVAKTMFES